MGLEEAGEHIFPALRGLIVAMDDRCAFGGEPKWGGEVVMPHMSCT